MLQTVGVAGLKLLLVVSIAHGQCVNKVIPWRSSTRSGTRTLSVPHDGHTRFVTANFVEAIDVEKLNFWTYEAISLNHTQGEMGFAMNYLERHATYYVNTPFSRVCTEIQMPALMAPAWLVIRAYEFLYSFLLTCNRHEEGLDVYEADVKFPQDFLSVEPGSDRPRGDTGMLEMGLLFMFVPKVNISGIVKTDADSLVREAVLEVRGEKTVVYKEIAHAADTVGPKSVEVPEGWGPCTDSGKRLDQVMNEWARREKLVSTEKRSAEEELWEQAVSPLKGSSSMLSLSLTSASLASMSPDSLSESKFSDSASLQSDWFSEAQPVPKSSPIFSGLSDSLSESSSNVNHYSHASIE